MGRKRIVWVTGASGFSGRHLIDFLRTLREPLDIIGLDCRPCESPGLDAGHVVDLMDRVSLEKLADLHPPSRVFHLAGLLPPAPEGDMWRINVGATQTLLRALGVASGRKKPRVVSIGSAAEYVSSPAVLNEKSRCGGESPYGRTKWAQTLVALGCGRQYGLDVMIARTFNLLGPGLSASLVAGSLCAQFSRGDLSTVRVGNLRPRRDFLDVRDAVRAYWQIGERGTAGNVYNVCSGRSTSVAALVKMFAASVDGAQRIEHESGRMRDGDIDRVWGDNSRLCRLGWSPDVSLRQSVRDMLAEARKR